MKILNITKFNFEFSGGVEKEAREVSRQLSRENIVENICFGDNSLVSKLNESEKIIQFKSYRIFNKVDVSLSQFLFILRNHKKYDLIWVHYPNILPVLSLVLCINSPKIVLHWHNDIQVLPSLYKVFKIFETLIIRRAVKIITTSPEYYKYSNAISLFGDKVHCIPIKIKQGNTIIKRNIPDYSKKIILTTIGRYTPYKGYKELIEEIRKYKNLELNIISKSKFPSEISDSISNSSNIIHFNNASDSQIDDILRNSHIYIMSSLSRNEGYGIVLLEALRCGLPLCVNKVVGTGSAFIVKPGMNGEYFEFLVENSLINSITKIMHPGKYEKYCANAVADFNERFKLEKSNDYYSFIQNLSK